MVGIVAYWVCKCGTRLKVIAERDFSPASAITTALCPKCGNPHPISADKITSVTEDIPERKPATCEEKASLLAARNKAFDFYRRIAAELAEAAGMMADAEFQFLYDKVLTAKQVFSEFSEQLNEHTAMHGC